MLRKDLRVDVGQTLTIDFRVTVQTTQETVTVTAENPLIDTEKTDVSQLITTDQVANLPLAGRNWERFALSAPGATNDGGSGLVSYRGISALYNSSAVDGANNNQAFFSETKGRATTGVPSVYSIDSIQEFAVSTSQLQRRARSGRRRRHQRGHQVGDQRHSRRLVLLPALSDSERAGSDSESRGYLHTAGPPAAAVRRQRGRTRDQRQAVLLRDLRWFAQSKSDQPTPAARNSRWRARRLSAAAQCGAANNYLTSILGAYPRFANNDIFFARIDDQLNSRNHINASMNIDNFKAPNSYNSATTAANSSLSQNGTNVLHERIFVANWDSTISNSDDQQLPVPMVARSGSDQRERSRPQRKHHQRGRLRNAQRAAASRVS